MTVKLQRFDFGSLRDFRGPIQVAAETLAVIEEEAPPPPPPPTYNESELEQAQLDAKKQGYGEGFTAGIAQAKAESDQLQQRSEEALTQVAERLSGLDREYKQLLEEQSRDLSELVLKIAQKVAGEAIAADQLPVIQELTERCLPVILKRPRLVVELHPETLPRAEEALRRQLESGGFEGDVQFRLNPALDVADVRLDWGLGHAERSTQSIWKEIASLLERVPLEIKLNESNDAPEAEA